MPPMWQAFLVVNGELGKPEHRIAYGSDLPRQAVSCSEERPGNVGDAQRKGGGGSGGGDREHGLQRIAFDH